MTESPPERRIAAASALRWGLVWLAIAVVVYFAWQLREVLILAFLALLLAAALHPLEQPLERWKVPRILGIVAVYLGVLAVVALILWLVIPPLVEQLVELFQNIPAFLGGAEAWLRQQLDALPGDIGDQGFEQLQEQVTGAIPDLSGLAEIPMIIVGALIDLVLVVFLSALLLLERDRLWKALLTYIRPERREKVNDVAQRVVEKLGAYVRGQLVIMTIIGIATGIGMFVLGVPFVLPLSFLAFLTEAIPLVGPWVSGVPIVLIAFSQDLWTGIFMAAWVVGIQQLESLVLAPVVQNKALELSPVVILLAVVAGGTLGGVIGALIAIPIAAVGQVLLAEVVLPFRRERWGESSG